MLAVKEEKLKSHFRVRNLLDQEIKLNLKIQNIYSKSGLDPRNTIIGIQYKRMLKRNLRYNQSFK